MEAAFKPEVKNELDTQNFEKFEEVGLLSTLLFAEHSFLNLFEQPTYLQLGVVSGSLSLASAIESKVYDSLKAEMLS